MPPSKRSAPVPYWVSECGRAVVYVGDCLEVMSPMDPRQFHAVITDPPYGLEFMGREWDAPWKDGSVGARHARSDEMGDPVKAQYLRHNTTYGTSNPRAFQSWLMDRAEQMLRVARPGAHLLSFGGTRMWHRMTCAVEDAGWEIRDTIMWIYGGGFPKSHNVSRAVDRKMGVQSKVVHSYECAIGGTAYNAGDDQWRGTINITKAVTEQAKRWDGWGTGLKPAYEPIILARRPIVDTVADNVVEYGTGALNIDGCRVGTDGGCKNVPGTGGFDAGSVNALGGHLNSTRSPGVAGLGRWPANVIHDGSDEVVDLFPAQAGGGGGPKVGGGNAISNVYGGYKIGRSTVGHDDRGGAARFFYTAKADDSDRPHGSGSAAHPTVKPLDLMRYLVRLVCVLGGTVLDPFMGSGSTGCAALAEGMRFVGVEQSQDYADLAVGRLRLALQTAPAHVWEKLGVAAASEVDRPPPPRRLRS